MIVGYGICGAGEADRYLEGTLKEFKRLCDRTVIVCNKVTQKETDLINQYGFHIVVDDREWGTNQNRIKQDLMPIIAKLNPTYCVCLDMDEVFDQEMTKEKLVKLFETGDALYFYIVNLWNEGWNRQWSFWNIRAWKWNGDTRFLNKPLHCGLAPEWCYYYASYAPYFLKHYGLKTKESRQRKIERYQKFDPKAVYKDVSYYNALASDHNEPLDEDYIRKAIKDEIGVQKRKNPSFVTKKFYYVEKDGRTIDIPENSLDEHLKRGFKLIGEIGK